jgi:hypothetical protein
MGIVSTFLLVVRRRLFVAAVAVALVAAVGPFAHTANASSVVYRTDAQLVALSDRVAYGRVLDVSAEYGPDGQTIFTVAHLAVIEDMTGLSDATIEVRELGGTIGSNRLWVSGATRFTVGDQILLCLEQHSAYWRPVAMGFSAFHVQSTTSGAVVLRRDLAGLDVIGAAASQDTQVRTLDEFRQIVATVKGTQSVMPVQAPGTTPPPDAPVMENFALLGPLRWNEADSQTPVVWYRNPAAAAPTTGNVDPLIQTGLQAWTAPTDASIILSFGGTRSIGTDTPYCAQSAPHVGIISFEDPENAMGAGTLAVGGGCPDSTTTVVNGTTFSGFGRAFVIFNNKADLGTFFDDPTNFLRVVTHELGHGIGLDHTDKSVPAVANPKSNLMYFACCYSTQPVPPAIGPDDHDGLVFIYPVTTTTPPGGGGPPGTTGDADGDGLPDDWELQYGLNPNDATGINGANGDPDGDGLTNLQEYQQHTHPRGFVKRYLAEGVVNSFFQTQIALLNPGDTVARVLLRLQTDSGTEVPYFVNVPAHTRATVTSANFASVLSGSFATLVESDQVVVVDRTVTWGGGYGSSAETAVESPASTWYLAEGSTGGPFDVFYLLQNPNSAAVTAQVTYLRPGGAAPLIKTYTVPARGRLTIWVDDEAFPVGSGQQKLLAATDVSGIVQVTSGGPIIVERSMYLSRADQPFAAGHDAAGVTQLNTDWFLAEGATGSFFDMYVLIANPNAAQATVHVTYLLTSGLPLTKDYVVPANSRFTIFVDDEELPSGSGQHPLQNVTLSTALHSDQPIVVERAMWWPSGNWYEAHDVAGSTETGTKWAVAEGEQGGSFNTHTYVLIANVGDAAATVSVKAVLEDGTVLTLPSVSIPAKSRSTVELADNPPLFTGVNGKRFGVIVESIGTSPQPIVVERSMYSDYAGQFWAAGTAALGNCLLCTATTTVTSH